MLLSDLLPLLRASACTQHALKLYALVGRLWALLALGRLHSLRKCHWGLTAALEELDSVRIMSRLSWAGMGCSEINWTPGICTLLCLTGFFMMEDSVCMAASILLLQDAWGGVAVVCFLQPRVGEKWVSWYRGVLLYGSNRCVLTFGVVTRGGAVCVLCERGICLSPSSVWL